MGLKRKRSLASYGYHPLPATQEVVKPVHSRISGSLQHSSSINFRPHKRVLLAVSLGLILESCLVGVTAFTVFIPRHNSQQAPLSIPRIPFFTHLHGSRNKHNKPEPSDDSTSNRNKNTSPAGRSDSQRNRKSRRSRNQNNSNDRNRPASSPLFADADQLESTLLPPPPSRKTSSNSGRPKRYKHHMKRQKGDLSDSNSTNTTGSSTKYYPAIRQYKKNQRQKNARNLKNNSKNNKQNPRPSAASDATVNAKTKDSTDNFSSLLPPPISNSFTLRKNGNTNNSNSIHNNPQNNPNKRNADGLPSSSASSSSPSPGLSSWEDFLGTASFSISSNQSISAASSRSKSNPSVSPRGEWEQNRQEREKNRNKGAINNEVDSKKRTSDRASSMNGQQQQQQQPEILPAIGDLFPSLASSNDDDSSTDVSSSHSPSSPSKSSAPYFNRRSSLDSSSPPLEGVLPVSDLFYHASPEQPTSKGASTAGETTPKQSEGEASTIGGSPRINSRASSFASSASMPSTSAGANQVGKQTSQQQQQQQRTPSQEQVEMIKKTATSASTTQPGPPTARKRKTGRKMVRRGMEMLVGGVPISADPPQRAVEIYYDSDNTDWASTITMNSPDYGPIFCRKDAPDLPNVEKGLYCEFFVNSSIKWGIAPKDLREVVAAAAKSRSVATEPNVPIGASSDNESLNGRQLLNGDTREGLERSIESNEDFDDDPFHDADHLPTHDEEDEEDGMLSIIARPHRAVVEEVGSGEAKISDDTADDDDIVYEFHIGSIEMTIGVSLDQLKPVDDLETDHGDVMKTVLSKGVVSAMQGYLENSQLSISHFHMASEGSENSTKVAADFVVQCSVRASAEDEEIVEKAKMMVTAFAEAAEGEIALAAANAAREEQRWSSKTREQVADEFLDEDDEDEASDSRRDDEKEAGLILPEEPQLVIPGGSPESFERQEFGMLYNYSASNAPFAPYGGDIGLRLVDAVTERAKQRQPRLIAIGDVHGCIDELQDLLRQCDYAPGDLVVFLGDLVCKGPDSIAVVQMAREIGALGVRGNHDFEVIRWHRAIKAGVDPPALRSEHFHIASCLSKADVKWLYNLPWYMSSKDLGALFVHAGFVSGIRLAKQNPRLMMNMRSILPDGTVTSKFFNNWPWARLWDGPQTVLFGHDADRGLQQYEHAIGLDTGCVYGGRLTACILPERKLVSVSARREYFKYRRKHYD